MTISEAKINAKAALQSLIGQCQDEIRNLERFDDDRCLIATADVKRSYELAIIAADEFEDAWQAENAPEDEVEECGEHCPSAEDEAYGKYVQQQLDGEAA